MIALITTIVLLGFVFLGIYLVKTSDYLDTTGKEIIGFLTIVLFGVVLVVHVISLSLVTYEYNSFVVKRDSFQQTLKNARENGNEYETAAITKNVAEWNVKLAQSKYDNTTLFFDQYIDNRVMQLEPIK